MLQNCLYILYIILKPYTARRGLAAVKQCDLCLACEKAASGLVEGSEKKEKVPPICSTFCLHLMPDNFNLKFYTLGLWLWLVYVSG